MRGLFRRRRERRRLIGRLLAVAAVVASAPAATGQERPAAPTADARMAAAPPAIEITSPRGRSGLPGKVRIVVRITPAPSPAARVHFYVNGALLATDSDGPPYAVSWEDDSPFNPARLGAELEDAALRRPVRTELELPPYEEVDPASVKSIGVEATVRDERGGFVRGLTVDDFRLYEDGQPQAIDGLSVEPVPVTYTLLVDSSASMSTNLEMVQQAASRITAHLREIDSVIVAPFNYGITSLTGPTRDPAAVRAAVAAIRTEGGTAIVHALGDAAERLGTMPGRRVVVLVTDGYDENSQQAIDEVLERLKAARITTHVISIGGVAGVSIRGERLLRRIATETGGLAFFPWRASQLDGLHGAIVAEAEPQYRLTYTPTNQLADGTWRVISLETRHTDHRVVARPGYRASSPLPVRPSIEFTATDERLQHVDITSSDLEVLEDGVPQAVDAFTEAAAPVSIMLALDGSGSMSRVVENARRAAHAFVGALRQDDPLGVLMFGNEVEVAQELTTDRELLHQAVETYSSYGGTSLYDAVTEAALRLRNVPGRRAIVLVTDGRDENMDSNGPGSTRSWEKALEALRQSEAAVYAIGLGIRVDRERLEELAALTFGEAYFTTDVGELETHYRRVVEELHRRYVLAYTSTNGTRDGAWRSVEVRARHTGVRIRTRGGYHAPPR